MIDSINVLIVDDSSFYRKVLSNSLKELSLIATIDTAINGEDAIEKVSKRNYDIITLDVMMPIMNGIAALREIKKIKPQIPVIMISSFTTYSAECTLKALQLGAADFITKPAAADMMRNVYLMKIELKSKIIGALHLKYNQQKKDYQEIQTKGISYQTDSKGQSLRASSKDINMIAIGASTGGISSLEYILKNLGDNFQVPLLIVQHVPKYFMGPLITHLSRSTKLKVTVPQHGLRIEPGNVYIAPAGSHFKVHKTGNIFTPFIDILSEPVAGYKPSIDSLFYSVAISSGESSIAVILSGMGIDGVRGIKAIHNAGGLTIAQSPESSKVPGIIISALREKAISKIVPLTGIPAVLSKALTQ